MVRLAQRHRACPDVPTPSQRAQDHQIQLACQPHARVDGLIHDRQQRGKKRDTQPRTPCHHDAHGQDKHDSGEWPERMHARQREACAANEQRAHPVPCGGTRPGRALRWRTVPVVRSHRPGLFHPAKVEIGHGASMYQMETMPILVNSVPRVVRAREKHHPAGRADTSQPIHPESGTAQTHETITPSRVPRWSSLWPAGTCKLAACPDREITPIPIRHHIPTAFCHHR